MTSAVRVFVVVTVAALIAAALVVGIRLAPTAKHVATVIRRPTSVTPAKSVARSAPAPMRNIAPLATVTASSAEDDRNQAAGVADGVVDASQWVAQGELAGAWIKLTWDRQAVVEQVDLYDRPSPVDLVLGGTLIFDDGTMIPVPKLPPDGSPYHIKITPKRVSWLMFRIDAAQGRTTGLAEIMVFGDTP